MYACCINADLGAIREIRKEIGLRATYVDDMSRVGSRNVQGSQGKNKQPDVVDDIQLPVSFTGFETN